MSAVETESLQDAEPEAGKRPEPPPERLRYDAASQRRDAIGKQMREWTGARSGDDYDALRCRWVAAQRKAEAAYDAMISAELNRQTGAA